MLKIIKSGQIVDAIENLNFVRQNPRNRAIISCAPEYANGIVSSDGTVIWHLEGCDRFISGNYETVSAVEISEEEFNSIRAALGNGESVEESETIRTPLTTAEVMEKMEALQSKYEALEAKNEALEKELKELKANNANS